MRIAICEDIPEDLNKLKKELEHYLFTNSLFARIDSFSSGESFMDSFEPGKYQIIFMDIFMKKGGLTGMDTSQKIRTFDKEVAIILITTSMDYILTGYDVAVYYIVKPLTKDKLANALDKCHRQIERFSRSIEITVNRQNIKLPLHHIYYVEACKRKCIFVTIHGELKASLSFETLVNMLDYLPFLRCHRSYVINLAHVLDMQNRDFVINNGTKVPISRPALPEVKKKFERFLVEELRGNIY